MSGTRKTCACGCIPINADGLCATCVDLAKPDPDIFERTAHIRLDPFDINEHGAWCPACGEILAAPWNIHDDWTPPETCKTCGFPDFENGAGYFTDD